MKKIIPFAILALVLIIGYSIIAGFWRSGNQATPKSNIGGMGIDTSQLDHMSVSDWQTKLHDPALRCLNISEGEFNALGISDKTEIQQEAIDILNELKPSFLWYVEESKSIMKENPAKAKEYMDRAHVIAQGLLESDRLNVLKEAGAFYQSILDNPQHLFDR